MVAVVNGDLILESDIDAEQRFEAFQPLRAEAPESRDKLIERLIDRALILQQMKLQPQPPIPDAEVDAQLAMVRKDLPECSTYHCETDAGWAKFVADHGFTIDEVRSAGAPAWKFFASSKSDSAWASASTQAEIDNYYKNKLTPAYARKTTPLLRLRSPSPTASRRSCCSSRSPACSTIGSKRCARRAACA